MISLDPDTKAALFAEMVRCCVEDLQDYEDNVAYWMYDILYEKYPDISDGDAQRIARSFYYENYDRAYAEARESFEPTAREEALADIQCETMAALAARGC